jgi:lipopolysaccharide export system protein LptC
MSHTAHHSMDMWGPRRATSLKEARQRTALVHILRLLFTIGAVLSAGILVGYVINNMVNAGRPPVAGAGAGATMFGPRFEGRDDNDRPYVLTAETARRRREATGLIDLVSPRLEDAASTAVQARNGVWDDQKKILDLVDDVVMTDAAGYTFTADRTRMYVEENRVEGKTPLRGYGPIGEVRADQYEVVDDGDRIILRGNVWTKFTPKKGRDGTPINGSGEQGGGSKE